MFKKNTYSIKDSGDIVRNASKQTSIPTIINNGITIVGNLISTNIIEVFGNIKGNVKSQVLHIREGAFVEGNIEASYVKIAGQFIGEIKSSIIHITNSGDVKGDVVYGIISIEEKGKFEGKLNQDIDLLKVQNSTSSEEKNS